MYCAVKTIFDPNIETMEDSFTTKAVMMILCLHLFQWNTHFSLIYEDDRKEIVNGSVQ